MSRHQARRDEILGRVADHLLAVGIAGSSLRPLAQAAGVSDRMLLYYFRDKDEVLSLGLARVAERLTVKLDAATAAQSLPLPALRKRLATLLLDDALWPYMQLWLEIASLSARGEEPFRTIGTQLGHQFLAWGGAQLDPGKDEAERPRQAAELLASVEGLVLLKSLGLSDEARNAF